MSILYELKTNAREPIKATTLIANERHRQIHELGHTATEDADLLRNQLVLGAIHYLTMTSSGTEQILPDSVPITVVQWPWPSPPFKASNTNTSALRRLVKAGALIAAEIDRRIAAGDTL